MADTADMDVRTRSGKSASAFRTISEVSTDLDVPQHVLRFWESKFPQIKPLKRGGGRRYYRPEDVELLRRIQALLYKEGYTIKGVQRLLKESRGAAGLTPPANDPGPDDGAAPGADAGGAERASAAPPPMAAAPVPVAAASAPLSPPSLFDLPAPAAAPAAAQATPAAPRELPEPGDDLPPSKRRELEAILEELRGLSRRLKG